MLNSMGKIKISKAFLGANQHYYKVTLFFIMSKSITLVFKRESLSRCLIIPSN